MNVEDHALAALAGPIASTMYTGGHPAARAELTQTPAGSFQEPVSRR